MLTIENGAALKPDLVLPLLGNDAQGRQQAQDAEADRDRHGVAEARSPLDRIYA
jgi:hypothetical protein